MVSNGIYFLRHVSVPFLRRVSQPLSIPFPFLRRVAQPFNAALRVPCLIIPLWWREV